VNNRRPILLLVCCVFFVFPRYAGAFGDNGIALIDAPTGQSCGYLVPVAKVLSAQNGDTYLVEDLEDNTCNAFSINVIGVSPNGTLDTNYGQQGIVSVPFGSYAYVSDAMFDSAQRLLITGQILEGLGGQSPVIRLTPDGNLDPSFGTNGVFVREFSNVEPWGVSLQQNARGEIEVGGDMTAIGDALMIFRLFGDGTLDLGFGKQGYVIDSIPNHEFYITAIAIDQLGRTLAVTTDGPTTVRRYGREGRMQRDFGDDGTYTNNDIRAERMALLSDEKILIVGATNVNSQLALIRLNRNGKPDPDFGQDGVVLVSNESQVFPYSTVVQGDGKVVVSVSSNVSPYPSSVLRINPDGSLDQTFGQAGMVTLPEYQWALPMLSLQSDGKIIATSWVTANQVSAFAIARLLPNGSFDVW
jgi:uncharacterized delta-60 repeat protein